MNNSQPAPRIDIPQEPAVAAPSRPFWRKRPILIVGGIALTATVMLFLFFYFLHFRERGEGMSSWNNLQPGISTKKEVVDVLGPPLGEKQTQLGDTLLYQSDNEVFPHTIVFDSNEKVSSIFVQVATDEEMKFSEWIKKYGQPEKEMYNSYSLLSKTYIFSQEGIAVVANKEADLIYAIHYFKPTPLQNYLSSWGDFLSEENPYEL